MSSTGERVVAGRYRLRRRLGQGAMGTVWEAYDEFLRRTVSVKEVLLPPGLPDEQADELRERTLREARAIAALSHPNVITLHDVAREGGNPFVVTEYVLAHSLAELINVLGPLPEPMAAAIANAVAAGLAAAHQAGITHRDVKPGNVLIGVDGQVKLTDFGIARNVSEQTLTSTGIMLGSPAYIAPEVAAGREVTPAADLWGLGATLFAVTEGRPPYDVDGAVLQTINEVVHGDIPRPQSDGPLSEIIAALMVKDPADRISLREMRNRLHPLLPPPSTPLLSESDLTRLREANADPQPASNPQPAGNNPPLSGDADKMARRDAPGNGWGLGDAREADSSDDSDGADAQVEDGAAEAGSTPLAADPGPLPAFLAKSGAASDAKSDATSGAESAPGADDSAAKALGELAAKVSAQTAQTDDPPSLAPAPGPLPFDPTVREKVRRRERGSVAAALVAFFSVLFFFGAAGGGFALSRHLGGEPIMPPTHTSTPQTSNSAPADDNGELTIETGNAAATTPSQGGNFTIPVPKGWVLFVEQVAEGKLPDSTRNYYVSANGTEMLTVERLPNFYPRHNIDDYIDSLLATAPDVNVSIVDRNDIGEPGQKPESSVELTYSAITNAQELSPGVQGALDRNRVTVAHLLPRGGDLWVVSMTVPIEQQDSGPELFNRIIGQFAITG